MTKPLHVLVVEDEVIIAMCLELELQRAGYAVCQSVESGEDAIRAAAEHHPDVILMDIRLAGELDGIETAQQIQTSADIPIIFMTGYPDNDVKTRANELHPLGFFIKPVGMQDIQAAISSLS